MQRYILSVGNIPRVCRIRLSLSVVNKSVAIQCANTTRRFKRYAENVPVNICTIDKDLLPFSGFSVLVKWNNKDPHSFLNFG